ncbi:MAG: hypothetical protein H6581_24770 [Bacteroidia bacterium]|nr:hypothetical protein [Bacteroidia bacterium]
MRFSLLFLILLSAALSPKAQDLVLRIHPRVQGQELELGKETEGFQVETLRFYLGKISLWKGNKMVFQEDNYHLIDAEKPASLEISLNVPTNRAFDHLQFELGVDSLTNVSGAMGGDLDPTLGMYWAWNSGYINFKLEGRSPASPARDHAFEFHLGGYLPPFATVQTVRLPCKTSPRIHLRVDLDQFVTGLDLSKQARVMSPGAEAVELSQKAAQIFSCEE